MNTIVSKNQLAALNLVANGELDESGIDILVQLASKFALSKGKKSLSEIAKEFMENSTYDFHLEFQDKSRIVKMLREERTYLELILRSGSMEILRSRLVAYAKGQKFYEPEKSASSHPPTLKHEVQKYLKRTDKYSPQMVLDAFWSVAEEYLTPLDTIFNPGLHRFCTSNIDAVVMCAMGMDWNSCDNEASKNQEKAKRWNELQQQRRYFPKHVPVEEFAHAILCHCGMKLMHHPPEMDSHIPKKVYEEEEKQAIALAFSLCKEGFIIKLALGVIFDHTCVVFSVLDSCVSS